MFGLRLDNLFGKNADDLSSHALRIDFARPIVYPELEGLLMFLQEKTGGEVQMRPREYSKTFFSPINPVSRQPYTSGVKIRTRLIRGVICTARGDIMYDIIDGRGEQQILYTAMLLTRSSFDEHLGKDTTQELRVECKGYVEKYLASLPPRNF